MSWLARSIANTLKLDDDDDGSDDDRRRNTQSDEGDGDGDEQQPLADSPVSPSRGVKEDLSEITKTLTRQFWGVASFLAPPPSGDSSPRAPADEAETADPVEAEGISGIRSDFAEIGGKFRSGISKLSSNMAVSEITKLASNFLQLGPEEDDYDSSTGGGAVGVTDVVVAFVNDIAMHPETWLDFPLPDDDDEEDFELSDAQQEHALAVEHLAPRLAALRIELCPGYMSEGSFWKIYFVLLHPRLDQHDAELLSTPEIVKARALLTSELQNRSKAKEEQSAKDIPTSPQEECLSVPSNSQSQYVHLETTTRPAAMSTVAVDPETEKHPIPSELQIVDKSVIEEKPENKIRDQNINAGATASLIEAKEEDDTDDWLEEASSEMVVSTGTSIPIENEEDVSFSDLEEDDGDIPTSYKKVTYVSDSSTKESPDWVRLGSSADSSKDNDSVTIERAGSGQVSVHNSETKESNDWLDVDDIDVA